MNNDRPQRDGRGKNDHGNYGRPKNTFEQLDIRPMELPEDYVQEAENVIKKGHKISTSKIRSILSLVSDIYNDENIRTEAALLKSSKERIQLMRVRILYEAGRDSNVKKFIEESHLINYIKSIGDSREKFIIFARYMEALVAYHKFVYGND